MATRTVSLSHFVPALLLLTALATIGVGYGLWSQTLVVEGTVQTGKIDARWVDVNCSEFYPWPEGGNSGEVEGKDVGITEAWIDPDGQTMHIEVTNAYPSYAVDCQVHFWIEGTIPVKLRGTQIMPISNLTNCVPTGKQTKILTCDQMTIEFWDGIGSQIEPPDGGANSLRFHVEQSADENTQYQFDVRVCFAQWNESATEAECFANAQ